jgi:arsenate reductase
MDFVITVCDQAAGEACPVWPGKPMIAHWGVKDPSLYVNDPAAAKQVIHAVAHILERRIELLVSLPLESLERLPVHRQLSQIGSA